MSSFVRNHRSVSQIGCTILHSHLRTLSETGVLIAPHPYQHSVLSVFQVLAILLGL